MATSSLRGDANPLVTDLGSALLNQAKYPEAEEVYRGNLKLKERKLGPDHPDVCAAGLDEPVIPG